jgi:hypothetical protein
MTTAKGLKGLTIVTVLLAGGITMAQGPGTGAYPPVAGGAGGNPITNPGYYATGGYTAAPGHAVPVAPHHRRSLYMYAPPRRSSHHTQK